MVHFAPLNARGQSNSPYSIYDQLALSDDLFREKGLSEDEKEKKLKETLDLVRSRNGILSVTDVVWNHTACNSAWLEEHPEAAYNLVTAPHLRSAYELDDLLLEFSVDIEKVYGLPPKIRTEEQLQKVMSTFKDAVLPKLRLWEFYVVDVEKSVEELRATMIDPLRRADDSKYQVHIGALSLKDRADLLRKDGLRDARDGMRYSKTIDMDVAFAFVDKLAKDCNLPDVEAVLVYYRAVLNEVNLVYYEDHDADVKAVLENVTSRARYLRVDAHGPRLGPLCQMHPLNDTYFTRLPRNETTAKRHADELMLANNGWIWNADPLLNFAGPESKAYLRREVIAWGDCVKLRYGDKPEDNKWLWSHQEEYTRKMARLFAGFRIDNCHSTPMHVAAHLLDVARTVNPDLYVFAELFTGSEEKDIMFVSKLGINSLIREAMNAWDPHELSRLTHRFGGQPVGSLTFPPEHFPLEMLGHFTGSQSFSAHEDEIIVDVKGSSPHALFMDCTHDNETPHQRRTADDTLPNAAVVAMSSCAIGSVKGYDEIVPELLDVVTEKRKYRVPEPFEGILPAKSVLNHIHLKMAREGYVEIHVHQEHDFISIHRVHPVSHDGYLLIARNAFQKEHGKDVHSPIYLRNQRVRVTMSSSLTVQAAPVPHEEPPVDHEHETDSMLPPQSPVQMYHAPSDSEFPTAPNAEDLKMYRRILGSISGLPSLLSFSTALTTHANIREEPIGGEDFNTVISVNPGHFKPGSVVMFRTWVAGSGLDEAQEVNVVAEAVECSGVTEAKPRPVTPVDAGPLQHLWRLMGLEDRNVGIELMVKLGLDIFGAAALWFGTQPGKWPPGLQQAVEQLDLMEINVALYRAGQEEQDSIGDGAYDVPGFGSLAYCGLQGFASALQPIARTNDLGHPIFSNLRNGPWMLDYVSGRLKKYQQYYPALAGLQKWLEDRLHLVKQLSASFVPKYFTLVVMAAYQALKYRAISFTPAKFILAPAGGKHGVTSAEVFLQACALSAYQLYGRVGSTGLFPGKYPLGPVGPGPAVVSGEGKPRDPALAAGLPFFATAHMRCWGRDVFIALPGLLILTGHFEAAKAHLIAFGSTLRHGLIPNLLDQGWMPRYNARDAAWWWLWCVTEYCRLAPEGLAFLGTEVARRFTPKRRYRQSPEFGVAPDDDASDGGDSWSDPEDKSKSYAYKNTIAELCHEVLERHARGVWFREFNAGPKLDHAMRSEGFDVGVRTNWDWEKKGAPDGIVLGGNRWNCGTWMDKMGDSEKAGTKGVPATPRDGAAVEINGLLKSSLQWVVTEASKGGKTWWKWKGVAVKDANRDDKFISYEEWNNRLQKSFEHHFYVPSDPADDAKYAVATKLIARRGIYKDTVGASLDFMDYQLRPNICIAMAVAPELFDPERARGALQIVKQVLVGPLGMKTLDPKDWAYRGDYDNSNDGTDSAVAHGFNYHQGPEWVWVLGFYLQAYLHFFTKSPGCDKSAIPAHIQYVNRVILRHKLHILDAVSSPWAGLPELTNKNGEYCRDSCPTQAWSTGMMVAVMKDLISQV
ncbi:hypothetical protein HK097_009921 [Rhizophlyctis rosea]|uniref:Uncharacterized protein n=1 Tax=Rhizophlyctis rosea TaxID=64517 RepID=A0AAD5SKQ9_9FUNG|nr:hypothetical protein HK097_009921 [Rhizophlyctis rosea]